MRCRVGGIPHRILRSCLRGGVRRLKMDPGTGTALTGGGARGATVVSGDATRWKDVFLRSQANAEI